jgi:predicted TIM-barrel fold metal-dependent hydrolase
MSAPARIRTVDVDIHCAPASMRDLTVHMPTYWRNYVVESGLMLSPTQGGAYPPAARPAGVPAHSRDELPVATDTAILTCTTSFHCNRNPYYEAALCRAINDWLLAEWHDDRLRVGIVVPTLDTDAAVAEIARVGGHPGVVTVVLPVRTDSRWGNVRYRPLLRAAAEHDLVVTLHAWGRTGNAPNSSGITHSYLEDYLANSQMLAQAQLTSLVAEGVFAQLPALRVSVAECGSTWLPALLWRFDKDWKGVWREVPWVDRAPSEVVREHVRFSTAPVHLPADPVAAREALDLLGPELLMHASDHPHDHGPGAARLAAVLTEPEREAVAGATAVAWYRLGQWS